MKKILLSGVLALGMGIAAQAVPINGSIGFGGTYTQNGGTAGELNTATSMTINTVDIMSTTGDFVGAGAPVTFASPIGVNGNAPSLIGSSLWTVNVAGVTYKLTVSTETQPFASSTQLNLEGTGVMTRNGLDATLGTWQLGFGVSGQSFTWQSTSASALPDGGMTVSLLGLALGGLGLVRRKFVGA
jgi:hypothetical protein